MTSTLLSVASPGFQIKHLKNCFYLNQRLQACDRLPKGGGVSFDIV